MKEPGMRFPLKGVTESTLKRHFEARLRDMTQDDCLLPGLAITVIANLAFLGKVIPATLFNHLDYGAMSGEEGEVLGEVMRKVREGRIDLSRPKREPVGEFVLQLNMMRAFKPERSGHGANPGLRAAPKPGDFNYNWPACEAEVFLPMQIPTDGGDVGVDCLFNRYPFASYHFLWVPERRQHHGQYIHADDDLRILQAAWAFVQHLGGSIRLCYNSLGCHASVNHLHLQGFLAEKDQKLPFEKIIPGALAKDTVVNWHGVNATWIPKCEGRDVISDLQRFMKAVEQQDQTGERIAYNLCMSQDGIACFARLAQGVDPYQSALARHNFTGGLGFLEMLGEFVCANKEIIADFDTHKGSIQKGIDCLYKAVSCTVQDP
jgi:hypothetical protein